NAGALPPLNRNTPSPGTWHLFVLPYIELDTLYKLAEAGSIFTVHGYALSSTFYCPSEISTPNHHCPHGHGNSNYAPNFQVFGSRVDSSGNYTSKYKISNIPDGTSNVIFIAERFALLSGGQENCWTCPAPGSYGTQFAYQSQAVPQVGIRVDESDWL